MLTLLGVPGLLIGGCLVMQGTSGPPIGTRDKGQVIIGAFGIALFLVLLILFIRGFQRWEWAMTDPPTLLCPNCKAPLTVDVRYCVQCGWGFEPSRTGETVLYALLVLFVGFPLLFMGGCGFLVMAGAIGEAVSQRRVDEMVLFPGALCIIGLGGFTLLVVHMIRKFKRDWPGTYCQQKPMDTTATKTAGEKLEGIAFTFCKAGTLVLITGRFALPIISGIAAVLFAAAYLKGKKDTRCVLKYPILLAVLWGVVSCIAWFAILRPELLPWNHQ
jgi:hypothetical protein